MPAQPLAGIRILDLTRLLPGPWATWILSAMGAEVIRLEPPGLGDYSRFVGAPIGDVSAMFHVINRGKRSVAIDLKRTAGQEAAGLQACSRPWRRNGSSHRHGVFTLPSKMCAGRAVDC